MSREQDCDTMQRNKLKFYTGKIKKREATSMEEKVNETTVQVDAELNKKKKVWESDFRCGWHTS